MVKKFTLSSNKLHMILDNQKAINDKAGLGYNPLKKQKFLKNIFVNSSSNKFSNITCFKCGRIGHKFYSYFSNKSTALKSNGVEKQIIPISLAYLNISSCHSQGM